MAGNHDGHHRKPLCLSPTDKANSISRENVLPFHEIREQMDYRSVR
jgi:hypothetical protein